MQSRGLEGRGQLSGDNRTRSQVAGIESDIPKRFLLKHERDKRQVQHFVRGIEVGRRKLTSGKALTLHLGIGGEQEAPGNRVLLVCSKEDRPRMSDADRR